MGFRSLLLMLLLTSSIIAQEVPNGQIRLTNHVAIVPGTMPS